MPGFVLGSASEARRIPKRDPLLAALKREHGADPHRRTDDSLVTDRRAATPRELVVRLMRVRDLETQSVSMGQV